MASIGEILEEVDALRMRIGTEKAKNFPISDEWGNTTTAAALLIQDPDNLGRLTDLDTEPRREALLKAVRYLSECGYAKMPEHKVPNGTHL